MLVHAGIAWLFQYPAGTQAGEQHDDQYGATHHSVRLCHNPRCSMITHWVDVAPGGRLAYPKPGAAHHTDRADRARSATHCMTDQCCDATISEYVLQALGIVLILERQYHSAKLRHRCGETFGPRIHIHAMAIATVDEVAAIEEVEHCHSAQIVINNDIRYNELSNGRLRRHKGMASEVPHMKPWEAPEGSGQELRLPGLHECTVL